MRDALLFVEAREIRQHEADGVAQAAIGFDIGFQDVLADALVFRRDHPDAALVDQAADHVGVGAFGDFDDRAFRIVIVVG